MDKKDVKKYIKYLCHQIDLVEDDISEAYKSIELSRSSLKAIKSIVNQMSNDVYLSEVASKTTKFENFKDYKVDVVYETKDGIKKEFDVPVHPYTEVEERDIFSKIENIAKTDTCIGPDRDIHRSEILPATLEEKAKAFQKCCGKCLKKAKQ